MAFPIWIFYILLIVAYILYVRHVYSLLFRHPEEEPATTTRTERRRRRRERGRGRRNGHDNNNNEFFENANRQGNIYTISDDSAISSGPPRFADFFYLEPGSEEAARIRAQLEKDDKELPSYDEVMRMASEQTVQPATSLGVSTSSMATVMTELSSVPAPPYTEVDVNATIVAAIPASSPTTMAEPSTSRAAATATAAETTSVVINSVSRAPTSTTA